MKEKRKRGKKYTRPLNEASAVFTFLFLLNFESQEVKGNVYTEREKKKKERERERER